MKARSTTLGWIEGGNFMSKLNEGLKFKDQEIQIYS